MSNSSQVVWLDMLAQAERGEVDQFDPPPAVDAVFFILKDILPSDPIHHIARFLRPNRVEYLCLHTRWMISFLECDMYNDLKKEARRQRALLL